MQSNISPPHLDSEMGWTGEPGRRIISSIGKTKIIEFFGEKKNIFKMFRFLDLWLFFLTILICLNFLKSPRSGLYLLVFSKSKKKNHDNGIKSNKKTHALTTLPPPGCCASLGSRVSGLESRVSTAALIDFLKYTEFPGSLQRCLSFTKTGLNQDTYQDTTHVPSQDTLQETTHVNSQDWFRNT